MNDFKDCVPDLRKERLNCSFYKDEITHMLDGGPDKTLLRKNLEKTFLNDAAFKDPIPPEYMSHKEHYNNELRKATSLIYKINNDEHVKQIAGQIEGISMLLGSSVSSAISKEGNPLTLHYVMFMPTLMGQANIEQQGNWMPRAWAGEIIGTYAQTELGHGTFLRGLETTATYDVANEQFVLNSPTITAYKWWPGGLGKTANYAIVMAQLYTRGVKHGPHPFIVQLRDEETHRSLPGIIVGEIGPRLGMNGNDNGFLGFKQHRIPRMHMLMKHAQVLKDGSYVKPSSGKATYGTMVFVRVAICRDVTRQLQRAVTIAVRYSAVRRQSELVPGEPEPQVLDYQTQQQKLFPQLASVFALNFAASSLWQFFNEASGNAAKLPQLHALSCGLKAQCSWDAAVGVDVCRRACGGHGYLSSSGLPRIWAFTTAATTYEGENTVMWLQTARYILKTVKDLDNCTTPIFGTAQNFTKRDLSNEDILSRWDECVRFLLREAWARKHALISSGMVPERANDACSVQLVKCAEAYIRYFTCERFVRQLQELSLSSSTMIVLHRLCRLYLLHHLVENEGQFLRSGCLTKEEAGQAAMEAMALLARVRPDAVSLVDSFDIDDRILGSALGAYDGDVYNRLYSEAMKSPLNQTDVPDAFEKHLKPLLKSKL